MLLVVRPGVLKRRANCDTIFMIDDYYSNSTYVEIIDMLSGVRSTYDAAHGVHDEFTGGSVSFELRPL